LWTSSGPTPLVHDLQATRQSTSKLVLLFPCCWSHFWPQTPLPICLLCDSQVAVTSSFLHSALPGVPPVSAPSSVSLSPPPSPLCVRPGSPSLCPSAPCLSLLLFPLCLAPHKHCCPRGPGRHPAPDTRYRRPVWWHVCAQWQAQTCSRIREQGCVWAFRRCETHVPFLRLRLRDEPSLSSLRALGNKSKPGRNRRPPAPFPLVAPGQSEQSNPEKPPLCQ
jgi:hypothetical protein